MLRKSLSMGRTCQSLPSLRTRNHVTEGLGYSAIEHDWLQEKRMKIRCLSEFWLVIEMWPSLPRSLPIVYLRSACWHVCVLCGIHLAGSVSKLEIQYVDAAA